MKAVLCPVCNGRGTIPDWYGYTANATEKTCHGCKGLGWVEVSDDPGYYTFPKTTDGKG